jgi:hypothetical protein
MIAFQLTAFSLYNRSAPKMQAAGTRQMVKFGSANVAAAVVIAAPITARRGGFARVSRGTAITAEAKASGSRSE